MWYDTFDDGFVAFNLDLTCKGELWYAKKLSYANWDHTCVAVSTLSGAEDQVGPLLFNHSSENASSAQCIGTRQSWISHKDCTISPHSQGTAQCLLCRSRPHAQSDQVALTDSIAKFDSC